MTFDKNTSWAYFLLLCRPLLAALVHVDLNITEQWAAPDGYWRSVYSLNGQQPGPLINVNEDDDLEIAVVNNAPVAATIHWHGLLQQGTPNMDGVPGVTQYEIEPNGGNFTYRFSTAGQYGSYWYHSHVGGYYSDGIRGPLYINPAPTRKRPYQNLTSDADMTALMQAELQSTNLLISDWTHDTSDWILAEYLTTGAFPSCVDSIVLNGKGRVVCLPPSLLAQGHTLGIDMKANGTMGNKSSSAASSASFSVTGASIQAISLATPSPSAASSMMPQLNAKGCTPPMMFNPGYNASFLPNATCVATDTAFEVVTGKPNSWISLNLINAGAVDMLSVAVDSHWMYVYAADGDYVKPQKVQNLQIGIGQRYSIFVKLDQPVGDYLIRAAAYPTGDMQQVMEGYALLSYHGGQSSTLSSMPGLKTLTSGQDEPGRWTYVNGSAKTGVVELMPEMLEPFPGNPPPQGAAGKFVRFDIAMTMPTVWQVANTTFVEPVVPVLYGNSSSGFNANYTVHVPANTTVDVLMQVSPESMDLMGHPMHLHGHKFWVLGSGTGQFNDSAYSSLSSSELNLINPPVRDTVHLPQSGWTLIRYVSDNPGCWIIHCHIDWHLLSGMAALIFEGEDEVPVFPRQSPP